MPRATIAEVTAFIKIIHRALGPAALHELIDEIDGEQSDAESPHLPRMKPAAELMVDAGRLPPMLVESLLPDHSLFLLTGKPKAGKSFLALDIADSVCRGAPVLGALPVSRRGPVVYLAMEDGTVELARRLAQRGYKPADDHDLYFFSEAFSLTDPLHYARFREQAQSVQPSLIVIDTAAEALDIRDWINRSEILTKIAPIRRLAREICTVLLVAHNRKAEGDGGDEIAGSNALAGAVDGWISAHKVERRPNGNRRLYLRVEGRGGVGHELITEMDHETHTFSIIEPEQAEHDAQTTRQNYHSARRKARLDQACDVIRRNGGRATISELAAAMGLPYNAAWSLIRDLQNTGVVEEAPAEPDRDGARRPAPIYTLRQA